MGGSNGAFEPGNLNVAAPYFISGRTGVLGAGLNAGDPVARLFQGGNLVPHLDNVLHGAPIRISQIRLKFATTATPPVEGHSFEILKGAGAQADTGGALHLPQRRKTTGYPQITAPETSLYVADTGAISGGSFTALDATGPIDILPVGPDVVGVAIWRPSDLCPLQLEPGEALEVRLLQDEATTGILLVAFDFLRG